MFDEGSMSHNYKLPTLE